MAVTETMVRMGELAVSSASGHVLVSLGLGSCIGLALVDRRMGIAGLAHVVLPESPSHADANPRKYADHAVPELVSEMEGLGARRIRLEAALVGGASMRLRWSAARACSPSPPRASKSGSATSPRCARC
jgi:chemotaxis protein CheD